MALAQDAIAIGGGDAQGGNVQYVDCSQVVTAVQGQYGDAAAVGRRAVAAIANEQNITVNQVNACLGDTGQNGNNDDDNNNNNDDDNNNNNNEGDDRDCEDFDSQEDAQAALDADDDLTGLDPNNDDIACEDFDFDAAAAAARDDVLAGTVPKVASLPNTGGPSLLVIGAGLALVAGGASLMRFRR